MGLLSSKIRMEQLNHGDHIYTWRRGYSYSHHGIYVGDANHHVIHLTRGPGSLMSSSSPSQSSNDPVERSNIEDFLRKGQLYRFEYGVTKILFVIKRAGTCSLVLNSPPNEVLNRASYLLENGFGNYNLLGKNCEDFALYCKTGFIKGDGYLIGRSGQINSLAAASFAFTIIPYRLLTSSLIGVALAIFGFYSFFRLGYEVEFKRKHRVVAVENVLSGHLSDEDNVGETSTRWSESFNQYFGYTVFAFSIWYWFRESKTLQSFIFYHILFDVVTDQLGLHGYNLEEYRFYAVWVLGYWYWRSVSALLLWTRLLCFLSFLKIFLHDHPITLETQIKLIVHILEVLILWYWTPGSTTLRWIKLVWVSCRLFNVVTHQLGFHGFKLEEYMFYAAWLLGYYSMYDSSTD